MSVDNLQWLGNFGFAAIVAMYVLVRLEPCIRELQKSVTLLTIVIAKTSGVDYEDIRRDFVNGRH